MKRLKALCLISGGLDSRLACKIMQEQCEVEAVYFDLPFGSGCCKPDCAFNFTQIAGVKLHVIDCKKGGRFRKLVDIIKNPKHGHGSAINPCIDCHIFLLKEAKRLAKKIHADFIVTGEVLNERPMSQHLNALNIVEKESGLSGKLLRPLSAKLLPETDVEKSGLIDRSKLLAISGRSRKQQIELAEKFGIKYPNPGGGCLLCEREFALKVKDLFKHERDVEWKDFELLRYGRHFRIDGVKIIVGRNEQDNNMLRMLADKPDLLLEAKNVMGPATIIRKKNGIDPEVIKRAAEVTARYSDASGMVKILVKERKKKREINAEKMPNEDIEKLRIRL